MKFLVFQHVPYEHPGLLTKIASENKVRLEIVKLWENQPIPDINDFDALLIMGGPMGVYENFPSEKAELAIIKQILGQKPILGFCLGSQLLAHALGARVAPNIQNGKKIKEVGFFEVELTGSGKESPLFAGFPEKFKVLQWHGDIFDLPRKASRLATSALCRNQAFSYQNAFGTLFHFEFTPEMIRGQIKIDRDWIHEENEINEIELIKQADENAVLMENQARLLFKNFLKIISS